MPINRKTVSTLVRELRENMRGMIEDHCRRSEERVTGVKQFQATPAQRKSQQQPKHK